MDELKKYLQAHRQDLDTDDYTTDKSWAGIRRDLKNKRKIRFLYRTAVAASILLITTAGYFLIFSTNKKEELAVSRRTSQPVHNQIIVTTDTNFNQPPEEKSLTGNLATNAPVIEPQQPNKVTNRKGTKKEQTEFEQLNNSFQNMIQARLISIRNTPFYAEGPDYFSFFKKEYSILEKEESTLQSEITQYGMSDNYLDRMISIYQAKLTLLKKLQTEIQQMNNRIQQSDPDIIQYKPHFVNI